MNSNKIILAPCPFCGGKASYYSEPKVMCLTCAAIGPYWGGKSGKVIRNIKNSVKAWNRRATLKAVE